MADPRLVIQILGNSKRFDAELKSLEGKVSKSTIAMNKAARLGAAGVTALAVGLGLAVKSAAEFEATFSNVLTLLDESSFKTKTFERGIDSLRKGVLKLRAETGESFQNLNKGLFDLISAGVDAEKAIDALRISTNLAIAGATDTSVAVDGITSALNAFELAAGDAQAVSEKFFTAQKFGKTTVEELSRSFGLVGPTAAEFGVSLEELLALVSAVTTSGIKTSQAFTGLAAIFANITKPTADASKEAKRLGIEFNTTALRAKGLKGFLDSITESAEFNSTSLEKMFGSVEAVKTILAATGSGADDFRKILKALGDQEQLTATFAAALALKLDTLENSTKRLQGSFESLSVQIGQEFSPVVQEVFDDLADRIDESTPKIIQFIRDISVGMATVAATIGDFFTSVFTRSISQIQNVAARALFILRDTLEGIQIIASKVGIDLGAEGAISDLETRALNLRLSAEANIEDTGFEDFKNRLDQRLEALKTFNDQELELLREQAASKREAKIEEKETDKEAGIVDEVAATDEEFEEILSRFKDRLEKLREQRQSAADTDLKIAKFVLDNKKKFTKEEIELSKQIIKAEEAKSKAILQIAQIELATKIAGLRQLVSEGTAASKALFLLEKASGIARVIVDTNIAATKALAVPPVPNVALQSLTFAIGAINVATIAGTAILGLSSAQRGGVVPGGFGGGDRILTLLEPGEIITPERLNPLSPNFDETFGGGGVGGQEVIVTIDLTEEASQFITAGQREDTTLGVQR